MRKHVLYPILATLLISGLVGCSSPKHEPIEYTDKLATNVQDGVILHAFNWSFDAIKENLKTIANAGYTTVQTSPVQQPKSGGATWWSLYQPVSFSIATSSSIGNKEDLKELCEEADKYGIKIICDIVFNHMATTGNLDEWGDPELDPEVLKYEPEIYNNRENTFHHIDNPVGIQQTTHVYNGLPDLNTSNEYVQERALSLLKECIDVGVDGFRFDAAKHIETPSDQGCGSYFWDNTLEVAKTYYTEKTGGTLYAYGEILNDCENGRKLSIYTDKYFNVTDNAFGGNMSNYVGTKKVESIVNTPYSKDAAASKLVLWAESHDTYEGSSSRPSQTRLNRTWAVIGARKDATSLYFARPSAVEEMGKVGTYDWENEVVASVNRFHNRFVGAEEFLKVQGETAVSIERYSENDFGAVLVNTAGEGKVNVKFKHLPNGDYYDAISGNVVTVKNGKANVHFDKKGVLVLTLTPSTPRPELSVSQPSTIYAGSIDVELTSSNATEAYYQIDNGEKVNFTDKVKVTIGANAQAEEVTSLKVVVKNGDYEKERTTYYTKVKLIEGYVNIMNVNPSYLTDKELYIWSWGTGVNGSWSKDYEVRNGVLLFDAASENKTGLLLAIFPKGYVVPDLTAWDSNVEKQTSDIDPTKGFYDASSF